MNRAQYALMGCNLGISLTFAGLAIASSSTEYLKEQPRDMYVAIALTVVFLATSVLRKMGWGSRWGPLDVTVSAGALIAATVAIPRYSAAWIFCFSGFTCHAKNKLLHIAPPLFAFAWYVAETRPSFFEAVLVGAAMIASIMYRLGWVIATADDTFVHLQKNLSFSSSGSGVKSPPGSPVIGNENHESVHVPSFVLSPLTPDRGASDRASAFRVVMTNTGVQCDPIEPAPVEQFVPPPPILPTGVYTDEASTPMSGCSNSDGSPRDIATTAANSEESPLNMTHPQRSNPLLVQSQFTKSPINAGFAISSIPHTYESETESDLNLSRKPSMKRRSSKARITDMAVEKESTVKKIEKTSNWKQGALIGKGAFGTVHIGFNHDQGFLMAVKTLEFDPLDPGLKAKVQELQNEIQILKSLNHDNIVRYHFVEKDENKIHICMEYVAGGSIRDVLRNFGPLKEAVVVDYSHQLLFIMEYLRRRGVVHRDIKGANVMITTEGSIKLGDFGSAALTADLREEVRGTPSWMAPEVLSASKDAVTFAGDMWSLGCTVMEMLTAEPPWSHISRKQHEVLVYVMDSDRDIILPPGLSEDSEAFLYEVLQRDPKKRPTPEDLLLHHFFWTEDKLNEEIDHGTHVALPAYVTDGPAPFLAYKFGDAPPQPEDDSPELLRTQNVPPFRLPDPLIVDMGGAATRTPIVSPAVSPSAAMRSYFSPRRWEVPQAVAAYRLSSSDGEEKSLASKKSFEISPQEMPMQIIIRKVSGETVPHLPRKISATFSLSGGTIEPPVSSWPRAAKPRVSSINSSESNSFPRPPRPHATAVITSPRSALLPKSSGFEEGVLKKKFTLPPIPEMPSGEEGHEGSPSATYPE